MRNIKDRSLLKHTQRAMFRFGTYTNEDRAIPDYRDGLKPVHRRTLWTMRKYTPGNWIKTARVSGDCIGQYHPHGDAAAQAAVATFVNAPCSPLVGMGNWGTVTESAAAARYTNVQLSDYGRSFLLPDYLAVTDVVPNYDDTTVEPVILPATLPNLLLNGTEGIGVGIRNGIPSYTLESVLNALLLRLSQKDALTPRQLLDTLVFKFTWGGQFVNTKQNRAALLSFYKTGSGSVLLKSGLQLSKDGRNVLWNDFAPNVPVEKAILRIRALSEVERAEDTTDSKGVGWTITLRKGVDVKVAFTKIRKLTSASKNFKVYLTERNLVGNKVEVKLFQSTISGFIDLWLKWRVKLEARTLDYQIVKKQEAIDYTKLMIYASDNLAIIMEALKTSDPAQTLVKKLKLSLDQANQILDLKVRQLSKLDKAAYKSKLEQLTKALNVLVAWRKNPVKKVQADLQATLDAIAG